MRRLIYISRSTIENSRSEIEQIIASSVRRNGRSGVTGMLWTDGASFAQVLEGSNDDVASTFERILADSRHTDIEVVFDRDELSRQFGTWAMKRPDDGEATAYMIGLALSQRSSAAERLHEIVIASVE